DELASFGDALESRGHDPARRLPKQPRDRGQLGEVPRDHELTCTRLTLKPRGEVDGGAEEVEAIVGPDREAWALVDPELDPDPKLAVERLAVEHGLAGGGDGLLGGAEAGHDRVAHGLDH